MQVVQETRGLKYVLRRGPRDETPCTLRGVTFLAVIGNIFVAGVTGNKSLGIVDPHCHVKARELSCGGGMNLFLKISTTGGRI